MSTPIRVIPVILCGGAGTRLWPLSRKNFPKPFLKVGSESLIGQTVRRAAAVARAAVGEDILLVSNESYQFLLQDECLPVLDSEGGGIFLHQLLEPQGRNTAPAIALAAQWAQAKYPNENPVLLVLPADHLINPVADFVQVAQQAVAAASKGWLTCFGITPTAPETGFGYIQQGAPVDEINGAFAVQRFVEKPRLETAMEYLASGQYVWNGGMFALRTGDLIKALETNASAVASQARKVWAGAKETANTKAGGSVFTFSKDEFARLPDISIDYAVMEKASNVAVVAARFQWSDIGSWAALSEQCTPDTAGNTLQQEGQGELINIDSSNSHVRMGNRAVALLGVQNLLVNPGVMNLVMIEVQSGDYLEEDDIVRFDDVYGRA